METCEGDDINVPSLAAFTDNVQGQGSLKGLCAKESLEKRASNPTYLLQQLLPLTRNLLMTPESRTDINNESKLKNQTITMKIRNRNESCYTKLN